MKLFAAIAREPEGLRVYGSPCLPRLRQSYPRFLEMEAISPSYVYLTVKAARDECYICWGLAVDAISIRCLYRQ